MTLTQIAKEAHVSVSTASKAFSGSTEVNEETRELVFQIAKKHGCFKKFYNAKYPKLVIAVIAPEFSSMYYSRYLALIQKNLHNCELCVSTYNFSKDCQGELIDYYYKHANVDGIILIDPIAELEQPMEIPTVVLHNNFKSANTAVSVRLQEALTEALDYLKSAGVTAIGFIGEGNTKTKERLFREAMTEAGLPIHDHYILRTTTRFEEGGYQAITALIAQGPLPRALICGYDYMAIGAIRCLKDHGYRVPEDVAILGMDDLPEAKYLDPPLASISAVPEARCRIAAEAMLKIINGEEAQKNIVIPAKFHNRESFSVHNV